MQKMTPDLLGMAFTRPVIQAEVDSAGVITINGREVTPVNGQAPAVTCISAAVWLVGTQYGDGVLAPMHVRDGQDSLWYVLKGDITGAILRGPNDANFSPIDPLDAMAFASDDQWEALGADARRTWASAGAPAGVGIDPDEALAVSGPPSMAGAAGPGGADDVEPAGGGAAPAADPGPVLRLPPERQAPRSPMLPQAPSAPQEPQVPDTRRYPTASSAPVANGSYGVMPAPLAAVPPVPPAPPIPPAPPMPPAPAAAPAAPAAEPIAPAAPAAPQDEDQRMGGPGEPAPSRRDAPRDMPSIEDEGTAGEAPGRGGSRVSRRAVLGAVGAVGAVGAAGAVAVLAKMLTGPSASPAGSASTTPRPSGTIALPSHSAPSPLSPKAVWEAEIKPQTSPLALPDGVAILTPGSTLDILDILDVNGAPASSQAAPADAQALVLGTMDGAAAIWAVTPTGMSWYPLTGTALGAPTSVTPPSGATVSWVGGNPLFTLPDSSAAGVDSQGVYTVTVPSGHTATAATDSHVLMVDGNAHYSRISRAGAVGEGSLVGDGGTGAAPAYICTVSASLVAVGWSDATGGALSLFGVDDGSRLASITGLDLNSLPTSVVGFPERSIHAVGRLVMDAGDQPSITLAALAPATCDGVYYYGQNESEQWLYARMSDPTTSRAIEATSPAIPWGGVGDCSLVVDSDAETWKVYALLH
ncbi:hypothetical protein [Actinomyces sp. zg296]|uniref:hypothetical protein n=1 Tax=Actinomyces sp. zg296 TaxID=2609289 RepID=UPI001356FC07|nr:hypothetical protein [Actinomyces sp. zg296]